MVQQINLYAFLPKPPKVILTFKVWCWLLAVSGILLALISLGQLLLLGVHNWQLDNTNEARQIDMQKIDQANQQKKYSQAARLQITVNSLKQQLADKNQALTQLRKIKVDAPPIFYSNMMLALAKTITRHTWLTKIQADGNADTLMLTGNTLDKAQFSLFLQNLSQNQNFAGKIIKTLTLQAATADPQQYSFTIEIDRTPALKGT